MRLRVRLPREDCHIAKDGRIPSGVGLPVLFDYKHSVGRVSSWTDLGDGTAWATLSIADELIAGIDHLTYGLDAVAKMTRDNGEISISAIVKIKSVGVWIEGTRGDPEYLQLESD